MKIFFSAVVFFILFCSLFHSCTCNKPKPPVTDTSKHPLPNVSVPDFNADSAYAFVAQQVAFGPRIPGTTAQTKCAAWMSAQLKKYSANVVVQETTVDLYNGKKVPCKNVIVSFQPERTKRILLLSHWDTRPWSDRDSVKAKTTKSFDGADDGGSGVGILIEIARALSKSNPQVGVDILLVDVEDYGPPADEEANYRSDESNESRMYCLGTQYWADHPHVPNYRAYFGILLDMSGARNATFLKEGLSMQFAPSVVNHVWDFANALGYGNYFVNQTSPAITDDHTFVNSMNGTPTIDIIYLDKGSHTGFAPHWHTQQDNMSIIDKNTLKAVGQTLLQVIYSEPGSGS